MSAVLKSAEKSKSSDYVVADLALADWGRKEIRIAETEMPGLMAIRDEFANQQPLRGVVEFGRNLVGCLLKASIELVSRLLHFLGHLDRRAVEQDEEIVAGAIDVLDELDRHRD